MTIEPTDQQRAFIAYARGGTENMIGEALAGSAKTTTVVEAAQKDTGKVVSMAFNTRIVKELKEKMPPEIECRTFNSIGHRNLYSLISAKIQKPDTSKWLKVAKELQIDREEFPDFKKAFGLAKAWGLAPRTAPAQPVGVLPDELTSWRRLFQEYDIDTGYCEDPINRLRGALTTSIKMAFRGYIDFDDQLYLPVIYQNLKPEYDKLYVDEAQDLSPIQHKMVAQLIAPGGRLVAVGDRHQAIYGFRGADPYSIDRLILEFQPETYPLTICFRCAKSVVADAQRFVPEIEAWEGSPEGSVSEQKLSPTWFKQNADKPMAVLCRNNAPLVTLAFALLREDIPATILGRDIAAGLVAMARRTKARYCDEVARKVWAGVETKIASGKCSESQIALLKDKASCISIFAEKLGAKAPAADLYEFITSLFSDQTSRVTLSTIHKAKGFEWPRVVIYKPSLMPSKFAKSPEDLLQEHNLQYVAATRAQLELVYWDE